MFYNRYRLVKGVRVTVGAKGGQAICDYPLRVVRMSEVAARLLQMCKEQQSPEELAARLRLSVKQVHALCEQLCRKGLLEGKFALEPERWPGVSIIVPSYNRAEQLERCLHSLSELDYPSACLEVLVVDDGSTDETSGMVRRLVQKFEAEGRVLRVIRHSTQQGVARSRNTGAEAAAHGLLAYIDSDCVASVGWLKELVPAFDSAQVAAVGGMIRAYERQSLLGRYEDVCSSLFMGVRPQQVSLEGPLKYVPTANMVVRREMWQQLGGFALLTFGEDVDFCRRLLLAKGQMLYLPQAVVYHDYRTRWWGFLSIRASYASAEAALVKRHPEERRVLILPPEQGMFAGLMVRGMWGMISGVITLRHPQGVSLPWTNTLTGRRKSSSTDGRPQVPSDGRPQEPRRPYVTPRHPTDGRPQGSPRVHVPSPAPTIRRCLRIPGIVEAKGVEVDHMIARGRVPFVSRLSLFMFLFALMFTIWGAFRRWRRVRRQGIAIGPWVVFRATLRGHLAYTYHLCRHLTRYYTLLLLLVGVVLPPALVLALILIGIVVVVDYVRLRPEMSWGAYALCSVLEDCAYEVGVIKGCIKYGTWKPLWPIIRKTAKL